MTLTYHATQVHQIGSSRFFDLRHSAGPIVGVAALDAGFIRNGGLIASAVVILDRRAVWGCRHFRPVQRPFGGVEIRCLSPEMSGIRSG